nr:helix-turn-helix domain-containing protein [Allomuricauda sp.]
MGPKYYILIVFLVLGGRLWSQTKSTQRDTVNFLEYIEIFNSDSSNDIKYDKAKEFLYMAKTHDRPEYIIGGYELIANYSDDHTEKIKYLDSAISISSKTPTNFYPANLYLSKGGILYENLQYKEALNNYLKGREYALKFSNDYFIHRSDHGIGLIKNRLGDFESAEKIHQENMYYFIQDTTDYVDLYLNSLSCLSVSKLNLGKFESVLALSKRGATSSLYHNRESKFNLFRVINGAANYHLNNYQTALDSMQSSIGILKKIGDNQNLIIANYYIGLSLIKINREREAIAHFETVDSLVSIDGIIDVQALDTYKFLNDYYRRRDDPKKQLLYLNKMFAIDSLLDHNSEIIGASLIKKYDIPRLNQEKESLIAELKKQNNSYTFIIIMVLLQSVLILSVFIYRNRVLSKRFKDLIDGKEVHEAVLTKPTSVKESESVDVPKPIVDDILKGLRKFEAEKGFLNKNITLQELAKTLDTNSTYLSKTINHFQNKNFSSYLNDLRISYAIEELKGNEKYRKFTISAIADMMGFKSAETFSKSFKSKTKLYPSFFLKSLGRTDK